MSEPVYKKIEKYVKELIETEVLKEGDLMPSEKQLSEEFHVTRMTVRSALNNLVKDGYIKRRRGIGSTVLRNNIYDNISSVSGFTKEMKNKGHEVGNMLIGLQIIEADDELAKNLEINLEENVWEIKRVRLSDGVKVSYMITYMPVKLFPNLNKKHCEGSLYEFIGDICNYKISTSERAVEAVISDNELQQMLDLNKKEAVLYINQTSRLDTQEVFEYSHTYHYGYTLTLKANKKN